MYESFYGFAEKPFNLTPDPKYLYLSPRHTEAFAHLEFGRKEKGGFILVTGEVGTGKTTLARYFLSRLDARTASAFVLYPALTAAELLRTTLEDFHAPVTGSSLKDHVDALHQFLLQARAEGREVVLLIDEAQDLAPEVLEQVRLISNLETDTEKLIQIVLMGQSELQEMLARRELRQLAQRVTARYHLSPLDRREADEYVRHRLRVAGGEGKATFTDGALAAVQRSSGGVPRLINLVCDRALLAGYVAGRREIDTAMVTRAAVEVGPPPPARGPIWKTALAAGLAMAVLAGLLLWRTQTATATPAVGAAAGPAPAPLITPDPEPSPAASAGALARIVLGSSAGASREAALADVSTLWGGGALERTPLRTHLQQVRRLDLPVVLEIFHPARADTVSLALLRIDGDQALVSAGHVRPVRVSLAELDRLWTRQATFVWRDVQGLGAAQDPGRKASWAQDLLTPLGYLAPEGDLAAAVSRFQRDLELAPDGVIGSRTMMALYSRASYPRPRLSRASAS